MKRFLSIFLNCLFLMMSGCASPSTPAPSEIPQFMPPSNTGYTPISIVTTLSPQLIGLQDRVISELGKLTQTKISFVEADGDYYQSLIIMASSGNLPDIVCLLPHDDVAYLSQWLNNGWLKPFDPGMVAAAPDIAAEYSMDPSYQALLWNGKIVFQPCWFRRSAFPNSGLIHVRLDILEQLGLKLPETLDDLYNCMVQVKKKLGIYGLVYSDTVINMSAFAGAYGLPYNGWTKLQNGKYVYANIQPRMLQALLFVRKLYEQGLIDPDSSVIDPDTAESRYIQDKAAFLIRNGGAHIARLADRIKAVNPAGKEWLLLPPKGPEGQRGYVDEPGFYGLTAISSTSKHPVEAAKLLNYLVSDEGQTLFCYGVEGIHYTKDAQGNITINESEREKDGISHWYNKQYHLMAATIVSWVDVKNQDFWSFYGKDANYINWYDQMYDVNQGLYQIKNEVLLPRVASWADFSPTNTGLWNQYATQILMGKGDPEKLFSSYVNEWYASGGTEVEKEINSSSQ